MVRHRYKWKSYPTTDLTITAVLDDVKYEWESVLEPDVRICCSKYWLICHPCGQFNPVELALYLLDEKDQGKSMESFQNMKYQLEKALKGTIDSMLSYHCTVYIYLSFLPR